ncbi:BppU family phage baseplate upper protein [Peribacillus frigoritolerans]|uniref:BppU family phage baseplate upper protein n=1 Tax=Peribacillus frigoritolerans TaxID=450367 RepID=UPI0021618966|nr:BppU family phage baseplate upper protein [Peribacillus frigoritolerans]
MFKNFDIAVDTTKGVRNQAISVNTNDLQTLQFSFTITQSGVPIDLTGATVRLAVKKPDKNTVFQDCTITDALTGKCEIILDTQAYIVPGLHPVELMIYYAVDKVSVTGRFSYTANKGILDDGSIVSTNEFQAINQALTDVENIVVDLRDNGTGIDAQARSDLETVTTQLVETADKTKGEVTPQQFGAKGDNTTNDNQAFLNAFAYCKANKKNLHIPAGNYIVDKSWLIDFNSFNMYGDGEGATILKFNITDDSDAILVKNCTNVILNDFAVTNTNTSGKKGYGIRFGNYINSSQRERVSYSGIRNVKSTYFNVGIEFGSGWIFEFNKTITNYNNTGIRIGNSLVDDIGLNAVSLYNIVSEDNVNYCVDIVSSDRLNFYGGTIENGSIGVKIRKSKSVSFWGTYFEKFTRSVEAGTDSTDLVEFLSMSGFKHDGSDFVFDRVTTLKLDGFNRSPAQIFTITDNVKSFHVEENVGRYSGSKKSVMIGGFTKANNKMQSTSPVYSTTYKNAFIRDVNGYYTGADKMVIVNGDGTLFPVNVKNNYDGKTLYSTLTSGSVLRLRLRLTNAIANYFINHKALSVRQELKFPSNAKTIQIKVVINYLNSSNAPASLNWEDFTLLASDYKNLVKFATSLKFKIDIDAVKSALGGNISSFTEIYTEVSVIDWIDSNQTGATIEFYGTQIFDTENGADTENYRKYEENDKLMMASDIISSNKLLLKAPNGTVYNVTVNDSGQLSVAPQ